MTNDQMNYLRGTVGLIVSETFNKVFEKPLNVIENVKIFIKVSKFIYKVVMFFDEKAEQYIVDENKTTIVKNDNIEYLDYLKQHPTITKIEKRTEVIDYLGKEVFVKVDRPLGSIHPEHNDIQYEVNYGFLPNTTAADNEEQDAYIIGINEPLDYFEGIVKAIIVRNDDFEDKLVVCANDYSLTREEIKNKTDFQEKYFDIKIIM